MSKAATLLFAHGGGFCKETWEPIMRRLKASSLLQTVNAQFVSFDFKYHGSNRDESVDAKIDLENPEGPRVHHPAADLTAWTSAEVLQQAQALKSKSGNTPLIGIGHSMGASAMWNTETQYPGTFDGLILFEPVYGSLNSSAVTNFLVSITLQRESEWPSRAAAEEHLRGFKNFAAWDRESLDAYMKGALVEDEKTGKTVLACSTPIEASLYCHKLLHLADEQLAKPQCKIFFHYGSRTKMFLPPVFKELADQWPNIYELEEPIDNSSHAMVLEKPAESAQAILNNLQELQPFDEDVQPGVHNPRIEDHDDSGIMETLLAKAVTLRTFLQSAAEQRSSEGDDALEQNLSKETNEDVTFALDHTFLSLSGAEPFPRPPWSCETSISHTELVHHVIEVLLARKRTINWEDADILTLGYREVAPEAAGHRVTQSNAVICYYPNTLVATLKKPCWGSLHELMGDDLLTHLLLNYTVIVQLKRDPGSYMQLTGKSLRRQVAQGFSYTDKSEVSINQAMFARSFQKDRVFASSHVLVKASKTGDPISRSEAARVLRSIFPEDAGKTRLPKRLINLIPTIQNMTSRFKACQVEELAEKLTPMNADFRKFMADNPSIKQKLAQRVADAKASSQPMILPIVRRAMDDGYLSQDEGVAPSSSRKRKRREEAIETLSNASGGPFKTTPEVSSHTRKTPKASGCKAEVSDLTKLQQHKSDIQKLLAFSTPKKKIYRLVRKFVSRVVPKELWGNADTKNWKHVKEMLRKLIFSRKFDVLSLKKRAQEFQVTNVKWMNIGSNEKFCPPNDRVKRQKLFESLLWWLVSSLVFPLLRNLFYITEAEGMANEISYYQRPVWNVISTLALDDLEGGILQPSSDQSNSRQLSTSLLRLLPKSSGVRPLMNLSRAVDQTKTSVNRSMEAVHRVLTFEIERQPKRLLGASVRNIDDIYKRLKPLFREITSCSRCGERQRASDVPMAYCVTVDVERCFDTIRPRKLYQLLKKAIQEEEYLIRKHWVGRQVAPVASAKSEEPLPSSSFFFKLERSAYPSGQLVGFDELAAQSKKKNSLFVDGVVYDYLTKARALELLKEHLSMNIVQVEGREYVQQCGIPQGSVLSTTLCNLYYAHFERRVLRKSLPEVCDPATVPTSCCQHEELFRYTDDFLYVTTDLKRAQRFYKVMHEGNEDYGCFVNVAKSQANFEPESGLDAASQVSEGCISWCGMLIDPTKLQVYVNYEKLGTPVLQHSIPFNETKTAQDFFVNKVISPVRQRWHALYFDPELLSLDSIHVNLFQTLLVTAHRFTILVEMLPFVNRDMTFFRECINWILKKMTKSIHRNLEIGMGSTNIPFQAQKHQVWTIGFYAFQLVIQTKLDQIAGNVKGIKCQQADWQQLLNAVHVDQELRTQSTALDLGWLLNDQRNAKVLKQFLHR